MTTRARAAKDPRPPYVPHCGCGARWTGASACHCSACHHTFSGITSFDRHRRRSACLTPVAAGLVERDGIWRLPGSSAGHWRRDAE